MPSRFILQQATRCVQQGGIIAYPTESVYGLGCDPLNINAVEKLLHIKNRSIEKGLILLSDNLEKLLPFIDATDAQCQQLTQSQNITWLIKTRKQTPCWLTGQHKKIAVRITQHPIARALCKHLEQPIISSSANPTTKNAAKTRLQVQQYFQQQIDFVVPGSVGALNKPTQIIDMDSQRILRA